jgi:tight adherence protein C
MTHEFALVVVTVFAAVAFVSGSLIAFALSYSTAGRQRARQIATSHVMSLVKDAPSLTPSLPSALKHFSAFVPKSPKEMSRLQKTLAKAGYHGPGPVAVFAAAEFLTPIVFGGAALLFLRGGTAVLFAILGAMSGYILPGLILQRLIFKRQRIVQNGLPDALDLFIVCLEAGSALDQAILKTSQDLDVPYPPLAMELRMITTEMRAGKPRLEAFKNFAARTGVDDVRALVSMLVQADRFGTSIAQALRTQADTSRTKRRQRAEERAGKIGVKLVFPLVFCLFPAFYVVTLGPGVIKFVHFFSDLVVK